jgi:excinuclease ABC subunit A
MFSPGFFPKGYLCKPFNHGYDMVRALGERYGFDPAETPWKEMSQEAQHAFLFGETEPLKVHFKSRIQESTREVIYPGFYGFIRDWDVGGTYTDTETCPACAGARLRPASLAVTLGQHNMYELSVLPLQDLWAIINDLPLADAPSQEEMMAQASRGLLLRRLSFLLQVGLGYLHLWRPASTLSVGEVQRLRLAGLLGSGLRSLTVLIDEPTRGMHPREISALIRALHDLRDEGNTVIVVEHDPQIIHAADEVIEIGPGAGKSGGQIVAQGKPQELAQMATPTGRWLRKGERFSSYRKRRTPQGWLTITGASENNLRGESVHIPIGVLTGVCGVSGSGKSTLLIDTLGRALAPKKYTTSVAYERVEPGQHDAITGAPPRTIVVDQKKAGVTSPIAFLDLEKPLRQLFAATEDAHALGVREKDLQRGCSACKGWGTQRLDMGFLPAVRTTCEVCRGSGFLPEAWQIRRRGLSLPELVSLTVNEAYVFLEDQERIARPLAQAIDVGLGYLVLRQPGVSLSGGEAQRLKIVKELSRKSRQETLFILDEPTVGLHLHDVQVLMNLFARLVKDGHSVVLVEHHLALLAGCDWLIELGPDGGPGGGHVIGAGTPETMAAGCTPTAPYLRQILEHSAGEVS